MGRSTAVPHRNDVTVVGRVTAAPQLRTLPSGDDIVIWRVTVDRSTRKGAASPSVDERPRRQVDALDCVAWTAAARRSAMSCQVQDVVEVTGALRRRFWRAGAAPVSRCEVEAQRVRRLERAG